MIDALGGTGAAIPGPGGDREQLMEASRRLEGVFLQYFTQALRSTVPDGGHADAPGAELYGSLLDEHLAQMLAGRSGSGLAESLYRQISGEAWIPTHERGGE
ncbi:MAG: rod-binding protein [Longimicrobiales bacterium]